MQLLSKKAPEIVEPDILDLMENMGKSQNHTFQAESEAQKKPSARTNLPRIKQYHHVAIR